MSLQHVMQRIGRMVAGDQMLEVVVQGTMAYALPGKAVIPAIDCFEWLGPHAEKMLFGCLFHECGHASYTNFEACDEAREDPRWGLPFKNLWNVIEDAFVERKKGGDFAGCAARFEQLYGWFWVSGGDGTWGKRDVLRTGTTKEGKPIHEFDLFLTTYSALIRPYGVKTLDELETTNPTIPGMMAPYRDFIERGRTCASTEECFALARDIYDLIESRSGEGSDGDPSIPAKEDDYQDDAGEGEVTIPVSDADSEAGEDEPEESTATFDGEFNLERYTETPEEPLSPSGALNFKVGKLFDQPDHVAPYMVFSHEYDLVRDFSVERGTYGLAWDKAVLDSRYAADALTSAFEVGLRASAETRLVGGYDHGVPDPALLAQYVVGACPVDQLFMQYERGDGDDVVVGVLLDCSGSMEGLKPGSKSWLARQAAIAIHNALAPCGIAHEITGFTTVTSSQGASPWTNDRDFATKVAANFAAFREALRAAQAQGQDLEHFARALFYGGGVEGTLQVPLYGVFKNFDQSDARGLMNVTGINYNLDGEAVLWQARRLAERPEKRRVLFVLSDGYPAGSRDNAQGAQHLKEAVQRVVEAGIEVYGLGIQSEHVSNFYPKYWVCRDLEDLANLAVSSLSGVLLRDAQERAWIEAL